jgi:hypothetical protein
MTGHEQKLDIYTSALYQSYKGQTTQWSKEKGQMDKQ